MRSVANEMLSESTKDPEGERDTSLGITKYFEPLDPFRVGSSCVRNLRMERVMINLSSISGLFMHLQVCNLGQL